jgi:hypothetical protein
MSSVLKRRRQIATTFMKTRTRAQIKSMGVRMRTLMRKRTSRALVRRITMLRGMMGLRRIVGKRRTSDKKTKRMKSQETIPSTKR